MTKQLSYHCLAHTALLEFIGYAMPERVKTFFGVVGNLPAIESAIPVAGNDAPSDRICQVAG